MDEGNQVFPEGGSAALVVIEFPSFRDFIDAYSPIISEEGIFIRNSDVSESNAFSVGDRIDFEVRLKDDFRLIQGAGEVVWLGPAGAADGASGTAIRFHDVDEPSRRLIARLVGNYVRDGGKLFEIGGPVSDVEQASGLEPGSEQALLSDEQPTEPQLTAETLKASEADALFAGDGEDEHEAPLEFESVAPEEVEQIVFETETLDAGGDQNSGTTAIGLDDPVGMETIAIPSGLIASASEAADDLEDTRLDEGSELEGITAAPLPELGEPPLIVDSIPGAEAALDAAEDFAGADLSGQVEATVEQELDEASLEAAADALEADLGGQGGIPDEIAQVAEELSGVHRYEVPEVEEASGVTYAGSASVRPERNTGGRIAALAVTFLLLGAGAYYFGEEILGFLGIGGDASESVATEMVRAGEAMPVPGAPTTEDSSEVATVDAQSDSIVEAKSDDTSGGTSSGATEADTPKAAIAARQVVTGETEPAAPAPPSTAMDDARRVERITWREEGGSTIVTIRLNTELSKAYLEVVRIRQGAPREVIKIQGVEAPYSPSEVAIGSSHVLRLRTGLHQAKGGSALHVVADLTSAAVSILSVQPKGRDLEIVFSRSG